MIVRETRQSSRRVPPRSNRPRAVEALKIVDDAQAFSTRAADWHAALRPADPTQVWFADEVARMTLKLDHAGKVDRTLRDQSSVRAETCWDLDRRAEAEALARNIARRPGEVVVGLRLTVQGCDYLIERWAMLAHLADQNGHWDEPQVRMAFDLLGAPPEVRGADPCHQIDDDGRLIEPPTGPAAFARLQLASLRTIRATLEPLDDYERESAINDLADPPTPDYARFRRHETALQNRLKWCLRQIKSDRPAAAVPPKPKPKPVEAPVVPSRMIEADDIDIDIDDDDDPESTDDEMVAWFRAEAIKSGFTDLDALMPTQAERDLIRAGARQDADDFEPRRHRA